MSALGPQPLGPRPLKLLSAIFDFLPVCVVKCSLQHYLSTILSSLFPNIRTIIKRPTERTTSTTSGQTNTMSGQTSTANGQMGTTSGQTNTTSGQTSTMSGSTSTKSTKSGQASTTSDQSNCASTTSSKKVSAIKITLY